jgi:hypothetical protein
MGREARQGEVGVVIDGTSYGITEYAEECAMPSQQEIGAALRARRVVPLGVAKPDGPLGLEHLAAAVARVQREGWRRFPSRCGPRRGRSRSNSSGPRARRLPGR